MGVMEGGNHLGVGRMDKEDGEEIMESWISLGCIPLLKSATAGIEG